MSEKFHICNNPTMPKGFWLAKMGGQKVWLGEAGSVIPTDVAFDVLVCHPDDTAATLEAFRETHSSVQ